VHKSHLEIQFMSNFRSGCNDICLKGIGVSWLAGARVHELLYVEKPEQFLHL
jgi:hypothetical protein